LAGARLPFAAADGLGEQPRDLGRGGGWIGAEIGSRRIAPHWIRRLLAIAGSKLALI
jgi:hypothetical protein